MKRSKVDVSANSIGVVGVVLGLSLLGCGARSSLGEGEARSSAGGAGGMEAGAPTCTTAPEVVLSEVEGFRQRRPALAPLGAEGAVVVLALDPLTKPSVVKVPVADVSFSPWGPWPPALAAPHQVTADGGGAFAITPRSGLTYSLLTTIAAEQAPLEISFAPEVDPQGEATPFPVAYGKAAMFIATVGEAHTLGYTYDTPKGYRLAVTQGVGDFWLGYPVPNPTQYAEYLTCGNKPVTGDGVPLGADPGAAVLVAASTSVPVLNCADGLTSDPTSVRFFLAGSGVTPNDLTFLDPLRAVRLTPRSDGAWLITQTESKEGARSALHATRIALSSLPADPGVDVIAAGTRGFSAAPRGDGFALAWLAEAGDSIGVALFDNVGAQTISGSIPLAPGTEITDPPALLVGPDGATLLVAWSESAAGEVARVHLARFDCWTG